MKKILISLLVIAMIAIPASVMAGTSFYIGGSAYNGYHGGGSSISFGVSSYQPSHRVVRSRVVVRDYGYPRYHPVVVHPRVVYQPIRVDPYSYVHRQQGRVYYEETHRRVIVVPSGSHRVIYRQY